MRRRCPPGHHLFGVMLRCRWFPGGGRAWVPGNAIGEVVLPLQRSRDLSPEGRGVMAPAGRNARRSPQRKLPRETMSPGLGSATGRAHHAAVTQRDQSRSGGAHRPGRALGSTLRCQTRPAGVHLWFLLSTGGEPQRAAQAWLIFRVIPLRSARPDGALPTMSPPKRRLLVLPRPFPSRPLAPASAPVKKKQHHPQGSEGTALRRACGRAVLSPGARSAAGERAT